MVKRARTASSQVGFILKGFPRLSETFIVNEILLLERLGYDLHILAMRNPREAKIHETVRRVQARVTYIPDYFWRFFAALCGANIRLWLNRPRGYWPAFRYALVRSIRRRSSSTIKRFAQAAYLVEKCLPTTTVTHFHAHFSHGPTTVAFFASWLTGIGYSFSAHAKDIYQQEPDFFREKIRGAQFVVTCTEYNRRHISKVGGVTAKVFRAYHGVDLRRFRRQAIARNESQPLVLSVGRLVPKKGFHVLLQALRIVRQSGLGFKAVVVGGGPLRDELSKAVRSLGLDGSVQLLPEMSQGELLSMYRQADILALACEVQENGDRDGIPNVLVEAMAMEIPVVSTAISGIPELVESDVTGLLVPEKNPAALAGALTTLLRDPALRRRMGEAGRRKVETDFDSRQNVERVADLLATVLSGPVPHRVKSVEQSEPVQS